MKIKRSLEQVEVEKMAAYFQKQQRTQQCWAGKPYLVKNRVQSLLHRWIWWCRQVRSGAAVGAGRGQYWI